MTYGQVISLDKSDILKFKNGQVASTTLSGTVGYNIKGIYPIIVKGKKCAGLARINAVRMDEYTTKVEFTFMTVSVDEADAFYKLYRRILGENLSAYADDEGGGGGGFFVPPQDVDKSGRGLYT